MGETISGKKWTHSTEECTPSMRCQLLGWCQLLAHLYSLLTPPDLTIWQTRIETMCWPPFDLHLLGNNWHQLLYYFSFRSIIFLFQIKRVGGIPVSVCFVYTRSQLSCLCVLVLDMMTCVSVWLVVFFFFFFFFSVRYGLVIIWTMNRTVKFVAKKSVVTCY